MMDQQTMQRTEIEDILYAWGDTEPEAVASMNEQDKLTAIFVRLTQLDKGQLYLIDHVRELKARQDKLDLLQGRIDKLEWAQVEHDKRLVEREKKIGGPARHVVASILASFVTALLTYIVFHRG